MNVFVICSVRGASPQYRNKLETYVAELEASGSTVHLPHRDTKQDASGIEICTQNCAAIEGADEVHLFFNPDSTGTHFDMGCAWALRKRIFVVENIGFRLGKSYARMATEWQANGPRI